MSKTFPIGNILAAYTGKLMCSVDDLYVILDFLHQDKLYTHQLPRASYDARPWLEESLPWLKGLTLEEVTISNWRERLAYYAHKFGKAHSLSPIPHAEELHRDAIEELKEAGGPERMLQIILKQYE